MASREKHMERSHREKTNKSAFGMFRERANQIAMIKASKIKVESKDTEEVLEK